MNRCSFESLSPRSSLTNEILRIQQELDIGFHSECVKLMSELGMREESISLSKHKFKKLVKSLIHEQNKNQLLEQARSYKKLSYQQLSSEEYGLKSYLKTMTVAQARVYFSARAQMLPTVQHNFKHIPEYVANKWKCDCGEPDTQAHLQVCQNYLHLQEGLDLASDTDLVKFFQLVIKERTDTN